MTIPGPRFITVLPLPEGAEEEVTRLFETIQEKDPTWTWAIQRVDEEVKVLVYSISKNQARLRGEWLTHNTELFISLPFETTHDLTLKTILKEKPSEVESVRALLKREKIWKEASKGDAEKAT
jgi:hypothetical protein